MFQAHTKCKKKKLNVGEVQTLPPLQFVISQSSRQRRETKDTKRQSKDGKETKTLTIWVARQKIMKSLGVVLSERVGYLEKAYYYDL